MHIVKPSPNNKPITSRGEGGGFCFIFLIPFVFSSLLYLLDYSTENKIFATVDTFIFANYSALPLFSFLLEVVSSVETGKSSVVVFFARRDWVYSEEKCLQ